MSDKTPNNDNPLETDIDSILGEISGAPPGKPPDDPGGGAAEPAQEKTAKQSKDKPKAEDKPKDNDGKGKVKKWLLRIFIAVLLIAILLLVLKQCGVFDDNPPAPIVAGDLFPDGNAEDGPLSNMTKEEILEQMQKEADKAYFSFKINTEIVFKDGSSEGNLGIENPSNNVYPMSVQIFLGKDGAGEMIYDSGGLMPDQHIDNAKLTKVLSTGTYEALAYLYAYDPDTKVNIFKSTAELTIIIKN